METTLSSEQDLEGYPDKLPEGVVLIYFKMVGVGPNTLKQAEHLGPNICKIVREQPGFFVLSQDGSGLRAAMQDFVNRFCDAQGG